VGTRACRVETSGLRIPLAFLLDLIHCVTIFPAGVAILLIKRVARLAAVLPGIEILVFVVLIHLRPLFSFPRRRMCGTSPVWRSAEPVEQRFQRLWLERSRLIFAGSQSTSHRRTGDPFLTLGRAIVSISIAAFGVLHFIYPAFAPGIRPMRHHD
jgi:hypothetical protein